MLFPSLFLCSALVLGLPFPHPSPDIKEVLLAHSNPGEFLNVHSPAGLTDKNLFLAAHTPIAPNPANSLAAQKAAGAGTSAPAGAASLLAAITGGGGGDPAAAAGAGATGGAGIVGNILAKVIGGKRSNIARRGILSTIANAVKGGAGGANGANNNAATTTGGTDQAFAALFDPSTQKMNAQGKAAMSSAMSMMLVMANANPNDAAMQKAWTDLKAFAATNP